MTALDTNVVVRFVVADDAAQFERAKKFIADGIAREEQLFISDIVLCELVWVLTRAYDYPAPSVIAVLRSLIRAKHIATTDSSALGRALDAFESGKGDFADYLIREHAHAAGCAEVVTFDKALHKEHGFVAA